MKIDVSQISGYENMTAEEKLAALEGFEFEEQKPVDNSADVKKLKEALSKSNSEAAEWKRQFREKQTEAERIEAERLEKENAMLTELESYRRDKTVSEYRAKCLEVGYDADLATATAQAMADGDFATIFANLGAFIENRTKQIEANALKTQPGVTPGMPPTRANVEDAEVDAFRKAALGI